MKIKPAWIVAGTGTALITAVIGIGVHQSGAAKPTQSASAGQVVAEPSVADALADKECSFLTKSGDEDAVHTVVLMSRTGVMAGASLPAALVTELSSTTGGTGEPVGSLTLITVGGADEQPRIVLNRAALTDPKAGTGRAERLAKKLPDCVTTALDATAGAQQEGSDELLAQQVAARAADTRLLVVSDGEANTGLLDLRIQTYPQGDPADAVARVKAAGQLPDFAGLEVTYYGIGQNRTEAEHLWLSTFYESLCTASGGTCTIEKDLVPISETATHAVPDDPPLKAVTTVAAGPKTVYRVDSASFQADTTELVDPAAVAVALRTIADTAVLSRAQAITVSGHTCDDASPTAELMQLSKDRAEKIAELLRAQGVTTTITATGHGAGAPIAGPEANGTYTRAQCAANRRVEIVVG